MLDASAVVGSSGTRDSDLDEVAAEFARLRPRLLGIAHRILGSWSDAEDTVQEAWLRWQTYDRSTVLNSTSFLVTTTTRLAINAAQSARSRHTEYIGHWLPEPADTSDNPAVVAERSSTLELGMRLLVQRLSSAERAAYVLRQAFDYPYERIAELLHLSEVNARQLVSRGGRHLTADRSRSARRADQPGLVEAFVAAAHHGEIAALESLLVAGAACAA